MIIYACTGLLVLINVLLLIGNEEVNKSQVFHVSFNFTCQNHVSYMTAFVD